jgi:polar amino acid transport system substrate-binding protein
MRPRSRRLAALAACLLLAACTGGGTGPDNGESKGTLERLRAAGTVRVGFANEAPFAYRDPETGRLTGEAPEIARVVLKRLGVDRVEGVLTEFGALIPGLKAGRFDLIAAGMYITPARCREIAFSNPTYRIGEAFLVARGNPLDLHSYADVAAHGEARLAVVAGAVERGYARAAGVPDDRIRVLPDPPGAVAAVRSGRVDAYAGTVLTIETLLAKTGREAVERAAPFTDPVVRGRTVAGHGAFGFRKADTRLREAVNAELGTFLGSPAHLERVRPFGFSEATLPGDATAKALCAG